MLDSGKHNNKSKLMNVTMATRMSKISKNDDMKSNKNVNENSNNNSGSYHVDHTLLQVFNNQSSSTSSQSS